MSQSEVIGAVLIAGFILWLAINRKLSVYWSLLLGGGGTTAPQASGSSSTAPQTGQATGNVLTGPGLTGSSTSTGQNVTSTPTLGNFLRFLQGIQPPNLARPQFNIIPPAN